LEGLFTITYYTIALEWDPIFKNSSLVLAKKVMNDGTVDYFRDEFGNLRMFRYDFLYSNTAGMLDRGTGRPGMATI
jgi:hypothetical protein